MAEYDVRSGLVGPDGKHTGKVDLSQKKPETKDEFVGRMSCVVNDGFVSLMLSMGSFLGLFDLMATLDGPKTSEEIAKKAGFRERYVREWLGALVCADVIEMTEDGQRFSLPEYRREALTGLHPGNVAHLSTVLPMCASVVYNVAKCFKPDGPLGKYQKLGMWATKSQQGMVMLGTDYAEYTGIIEFLNLRMRMLRDEDLKKFFAKVPGMKLESGIQVLEIGGSSGHNSFQLARLFPKSTFISSDISEKEVREAEAKARAEKVDNLSFKYADVQALPADWSDKFDLVFAIDVYHDLPQADVAFQESRRVLKPGGAFFFNDICAHSSLKDNADNPQMALLYACSLLYCLPCSLATPGSLGLGTVWGKELAISMLKDAGFKNPQMVDEDATDYLCIKD